VIRFLIRTAVSVGAAAVGLIVAAALLDKMALDAVSFVVVVVIFAVVGGLLGPFVVKTAMRNAPAVMGGIGLVTTFVALLITDLISDGLTISGLTTWILATLIVWLATMLASILLPVILVKAGVEALRDDNRR
jgi:Mycobacterial 4 TMS phage holin, superfamily IV